MKKSHKVRKSKSSQRQPAKRRGSPILHATQDAAPLRNAIRSIEVESWGRKFASLEHAEADSIVRLDGCTHMVDSFCRDDYAAQGQQTIHPYPLGLCSGLANVEWLRPLTKRKDYRPFAGHEVKILSEMTLERW